MALPRAYWKGYLKLSLVTCPVVLYPASSKSQKTRFHQINRKTGNRLRQQMVDERLRHRRYTRDVGADMPDVRDWTWPDATNDGPQPPRGSAG